MRFKFNFYYILIFITNFNLFGQVPLKKDKIYISEPDSKIVIGDNLKDKVKNLILVKFLKVNNNKFTIFDNDYIKSVLDLKAKQQLLGCTDLECGVALEKILQPDFKIVSTISNAEKKVNLSLKFFKFSSENPSIYSAIDRSFESYQLEFYIEEMVQYLINPNYRIRDEIAPFKIEVQNDLLTLKIKESPSPVISDFSNSSNTEKVNNYISDYNNLLKEGDKLFSEGKFWEGYKIYSGIVKTIRNDLTKETQIQLKNYDKLVYDKMQIAFYNSYAIEVKKIDQLFIEKSNKQILSPDDIMNYYLKYDGLFQHLQLNLKNHPGEISEVDNLLAGRLDGILINKWMGDEKNGDDSFISYNFFKSYNMYDNILQDNLKIKRKEGQNRKKFRERIELKKLNSLKTGINFSKNKILSYSEIIERKNSIYLSYFRSSIANDPQAIESDTLVKKISKELESFILSPEQELFLLNESISINDKVAKEINESRIAINDPFRVLVIGNQDAFKKLIINEKRKKEIKTLEKKVVNINTSNQETSNISSSNNGITYYTIHTLLFPFKYLLNVFKSITDIIAITPIAGLGFGTEVLFFNFGVGVGFPTDDFTITSVVPFEKDSVPGAPGEMVGDFGFLGFNTCENYFFIRGLGGCRANNIQQYTTLNFYMAFGVGAHVTFDLGRVLDIVPVLLFIDMDSIVYSKKYKAERIEYYP
jgi:hypothetical protein